MEKPQENTKHENLYQAIIEQIHLIEDKLSHALVQQSPALSDGGTTPVVPTSEIVYKFDNINQKLASIINRISL